jgi:hypothetical protein
MPMHEFSLILRAEPDEEQAEQLYASFQDGTISTTAGIARIDFHREADTLMGAIRSAIQDVGSLGIEVARIELEPAAVASGAQ